MGALPGLVGGGNGKVPPLTSAANAVRGATGTGGVGVGGPRGGTPTGGMMGGPGGAGHGGGGEHSSWLTEDDDPWGAGDGASPGILR
ncbi:hypothetical protein AB0H28_13135 [Micromonospora sp. NPDC050980]|uniref:hypothetical protein n=1 Tax=Micromonospora sp. NPDC050980 TaxID=3155161 RepID=UPI0033D6331A